MEENGLSFAQCFNIISNGVYLINMFHVLVPYEDIFWVWLSSPPWKSNVLGWFNQWLKGFKKWVSSISFELSMRSNSWRMDLTQPSTSIPCNLFMFRFMITFTSCLTMGKPHKWETCPKCRLELAIALSYASYFKNVPTLALYTTHNILIPNHPSEACDV